MKGKKKQTAEWCDVSILPAAPNPLFTEWQTAITKFLRYSKAVPCAHCGKKSKTHWTQLVFFRVGEFDAVTIVTGDKEYPPLTPVCRKHLLQPSMPVNAPKKEEEVNGEKEKIT